jgi:photosystem II stability/assembly factor-like uncharacterized protein
MIKAIFVVLTAVVCLSSCKKNENTPLPVQVVLDTLGAGWQRIKIDSTLALSDVFFVNDKTGYVSGDNYIGKSTDGGLTWTKILPDTLIGGYLNLYFLNEQLGWTAAQNALLRTKNGGASWERVSVPGVYDVQFFNADTGFAMPYRPGRGGKTTDGGKTFAAYPEPVLLQSAGTSALFFLNTNNGWINTGSYNYRTRDGGQTYEKLPYLFTHPIYAMQFVDSLHGWAAGIGALYVTTDGGQNFIPVFPRELQSLGSDIAFFDRNNGFVLAEGNIYSTIDGGKTNTLLCRVHKASLVEIHFTDPSHGWAVGGAGFLYRYVKP